MAAAQWDAVAGEYARERYTATLVEVLGAEQAAQVQGEAANSGCGRGDVIGRSGKQRRAPGAPRRRDAPPLLFGMAHLLLVDDWQTQAARDEPPGRWWGQ